VQNSSSFFQGQARFSNGFFGIYHSPFGVELKGRNLKKNNAKNYRFGFNGMEADDQVKGDGNSYDFGARMHDPRLARFFAVDPIGYDSPNYSPYSYAENNPIFYVDNLGLKAKPYYGWINVGIKDKKQWAYTSAAYFDIKRDQISFSKMDALEVHDATVFNSYHFVRVTNFYKANSEKEQRVSDGSANRGEGVNDWKACSPSLYYAINALYNFKGDEKIKSGYVVDATTTDGKKHKGIATLVREKGLVDGEKMFTITDKDGKAKHSSKALAEGFNNSPLDWAKAETSVNGVGIFIVSIFEGYHSMMLVVDRRGSETTYRLLDQHGNSDTGSSSSFDRSKSHTKAEIEAYFLEMSNSWTDQSNKNSNIELIELKRD
jgi:RHS repeat-associated protein